ncbi:hypothetical protein P168DRAFT_290252 [Aspergillus campestris IBT 28561]|uniref:BCAS2 family protein n=1 Tax=Aspergillus campestris (strain IBT 28561) TaxID=1392248 RepID=A0A2I1D2R8_ASPC2|nr:uncharacterized protein P168DRAFT_290252 [Aspergillus campestris IBT 28561]PKY04164.1 hypothetical protein P168DRAFT_290252 [Aspergillus campestris IBT 28561]
MPLINESHDSLPYIDTAPSAQARAAAERLITAELPHDHTTVTHPSIPEFSAPRFSPLIQQELDRKAAGQPLTGGIDLSRYEAPEAPARSHLSMRHENLALLEESGKNAWLIGNSQLEEILRGLEKELAEMKEAAETVNKERKMAQEARHGELVGLEESWKRGVGAILDVELAAENLRLQILEQRRLLSQQGR